MIGNEIHSRNELEAIIEQYSDTNSVYLAGSGGYGTIIGGYLNRCGLHWKGFIDKKLAGTVVLDKPVINYKEVPTKDVCCIVTATRTVSEAIETELIDVGVDKNHIYTIDTFDNEILYELEEDQAFLRHYEAEVRALRNQYRGRRCFIIGNGPSLRIEDLDKLEREISFACNSIYALFPYTRWRPTYYAFSDAVGLKELEKKGKMDEIINQVKGFFIPFSMKTALKDYGEGRQEKLFFLKTVTGIIRKGEETRALFSDSCEKKVYTIGTVLYVLCQLSVYMGFKEIVFLGVDMCYSTEVDAVGGVKNNNVINHQEIIEKEEESSALENMDYYGRAYFAEIDNQKAGFFALKRYADMYGISVRNATRGGKLDIFQRIDFDELMD